MMKNDEPIAASRPSRLLRDSATRGPHQLDAIPERQIDRVLSVHEKPIGDKLHTPSRLPRTVQDQRPAISFEISRRGARALQIFRIE
jgi:hypothetical protein